jgi:hypothetical protein
VLAFWIGAKEIHGRKKNSCICEIDESPNATKPTPGNLKT